MQLDLPGSVLGTRGVDRGLKETDGTCSVLHGSCDLVVVAQGGVASVHRLAETRDIAGFGRRDSHDRAGGATSR